MLVHATSLLTQHRLRADALTLAGACDLVLLPPPCPLTVAPFDFSQAGMLMDMALADAREFLDRRQAPVPRAA